MMKETEIDIRYSSFTPQPLFIKCFVCMIDLMLNVSKYMVMLLCCLHSNDWGIS